MFRGSLPSCKNTSAPFGTYFLNRGTQFFWKNWLSVIIVPISLERLWRVIPSLCRFPTSLGYGCSGEVISVPFVIPFPPPVGNLFGVDISFGKNPTSLAMSAPLTTTTCPGLLSVQEVGSLQYWKAAVWVLATTKAPPS